MRVLVIGGTGFLGPHVVTRLSNLGHEVAVYHRGEHEPALPFGVRHVHSPLAAAPVEAFPEELTGIAWDVVLAMFPIGERDARALMAAFRGVARRVVALSSGDVYRAYGVLRGTEPGPPEPLPLAEDAPLRTRLHPFEGIPAMPAHLAGYEKILVERAVMSDPALGGTVLRLPVIYGPGDPLHRFGSTWRRMADGRQEILVGAGVAGFRWTHGYVEDVANAVVLAVTHERAKGRVYNVGEAAPPSAAERMEAFGRAIGWKGRALVVPDEAVPRHLAAPPMAFSQHLVYDTSRIRRELDWNETVPAEEAFRRTAKWEEQSGSSEPGRAPSAREYAEYAEEDRAASEFRASSSETR